MEFSRSNVRAQVIKTVSVLVVVALLSLRGAESRRARIQQGGSLEYRAISCRSHSASLKDFGGVADGKTSNTKAFQAAIDKLSQYASDGGAQLYIPAGKWLTGSFSLTSHFTLYLDKDAVLLASQDMNEWPVLKPLPSYGRGRDAAAGRYTSLIFGTNLTDVVVTGDNGTIDGQGAFWWQNFHRGKLKYTRPYLIELMFSDKVQISNLTLLNSPSWNVHPVYSSNILVQGITIIAPVKSPNTDGINPGQFWVQSCTKREASSFSISIVGVTPPSCYFSNPTAQIELYPDSCTNVRIEDCYIVSGDDCIAVKSGWDEYGIAFGWPTKQLIIRRLTCISPYSAAIALGSEMSGGIQDVRAEDIVAIQTESAVRIKTAIGRGAYVKDIYVKRMSLHTMKWVFLMSGNYKAHPDNKYDPNALPVIQGINYRDVVAENVTVAGRLEGISGDPFTGICMSNVTIGMATKAKKMSWRCSDVAGITSGVTPPPCDLLADQGPEKITTCDFPEDTLPIDMVEFKQCSYRMGNA